MFHTISRLLFICICILTFAFSTQANNDSLLKSIQVGYFTFNDNNPIDNAQNSYEDRKRDDHGLTYLLGYYVEARFNFFKKSVTSIGFTDHSALYTKGLGTTTTLTEDNKNYEDYKYLLDKHPDWSALHVNNQISYSKNVKEFSFINHYKNISIGGLIRYSSIYSGEDQKMADVQRKVHKLIKSRNYYHVPFADSTIFKGKNISYFSFAPTFNRTKKLVETNKISVFGGVGGSIWFNTLTNYKIPSVSPVVNANLKLGYGKSFANRERKLNLNYVLHYEPNEVVQNFADPGTNGSHFIGVTVNFASKKSNEKSHYLLYTLTPYSLHIPIGQQDDVIANYQPREGNLRMIESFLNLTVLLKFN